MKSAGEHGTLYQLRNLLHRRSVGKKPKKDVNSCEDFLVTIVTTHALAATMKILGMDSLAAVPSSPLIPSDLWLQSADERHSTLMLACHAVVEKFVDFNFLLSPGKASKPTDKVFVYACQTLSLGLFYMEFSDAIREGDGNRIRRCWRYLLPLFKASGRTNYSLETLYMLYGHNFGLSPRLSHQLLWSRCVNTHGLPGHNVPCDLFMEHLNRLCKEAIVGLWANKSEDAIVRVGKAIGTLHPVLEQFDEVNSVPSISGAHSRPPSEKDTNLVLEELKRIDPFNPMGSRRHQCFRNINPLLQRKPDELLTWMKNHIKRLIAKR